MAAVAAVVTRLAMLSPQAMGTEISWIRQLLEATASWPVLEVTVNFLFSGSLEKQEDGPAFRDNKFRLCRESSDFVGSQS